MAFWPLLLAPGAHASNASAAIAIGPERGWIDALAISPAFARDGRAWAAPFGGRVFATNDRAQTWSESHTGETDPVVTGIAASPNFSSDHSVFAVADEGVFRSSDGGVTWSNVSAGLHGHFCRALALSPAFSVDHTAVVATDGGVYRSTDGGITWQLPSTDTLGTVSLMWLPNSSTVLAGLDAGGLAISMDSGISWQRAGGFPTGRRALTFTSSAGTTPYIVAGTDGGIWRTSDLGLSWSQVGAAGDRIDALAGGGANSMFAGSSSGNGVYVSDDSGASWRRVGSPANPYVTALASGTASSGETILAGTAGGGVAESQDGGSSWRWVNGGLNAAAIAGAVDLGGGIAVGGNGGMDTLLRGEQAWHALSFASEFVTSIDGVAQSLFVGTQDAGIQISHDGGQTWERGAITASSVHAVKLGPPSAGSPLFVAADYVYRSLDGGSSFTRVDGIAGNDVRCFTFSPYFVSDGVAFAGTIAHGMYRTINGGITWTSASSGLPGDTITDVLASRSFDLDHTVYASTAGNGIFVSTDSGRTWTALQPALPIAVSTSLTWSGKGELLAGSEHGVFALQPGTWNQLGGNWDGYVSTLTDVIDGNEEILYAGTTGQGVWRIDMGALPVRPAPLATPGTAISFPTATATSLPQVPPPAPVRAPRPLHVHVQVAPTPAEAGKPAVLLVRGPSSGSIVARLTASGWSRTYSTTLGRDGRLAIGFVAPSSSFTARVLVKGRGQTQSIALSVLVHRP